MTHAFTLRSYRTLAGLVLLVFRPPVTLASSAVSDDEARAAAVCSIVMFTEWPAAAFAQPDSPLVVGIMAAPPMVKLLRDLLDCETWHGRAIQLQPVATLADARRCHVLYVARTSQSRWQAQQVQLQGRPILTIGESERFAALGGIVELGIERDRLRLIVNLTAARAGGIVLSSKVLRLAQVLDPPAE